jgi:hypothetical protein
LGSERNTGLLVSRTVGSSHAVVRLVDEQLLNELPPGLGSRKNLPGLSQETLPLFRLFAPG